MAAATSLATSLPRANGYGSSASARVRTVRKPTERLSCPSRACNTNGHTPPSTKPVATAHELCNRGSTSTITRDPTAPSVTNTGQPPTHGSSPPRPRGEGCDIDQAPPGGCGAVSASATAPSTWVPAVLAGVLCPTGDFCGQAARWPLLRKGGAASRPVRRILFGPRSAVTIHLGRRSPDGSSGLPGFNGRAVLTLLGLAPGGACRAARVTPGAGALLPHRFTLTCAPDPKTGRHRRSALCCAVLRVAPSGCYPAPCPVESGRSSNQSRWPAATRPTRCANQSKGSRNSPHAVKSASF